MQRPFETFIGIDLGGARGKTTAVAHLSHSDRQGEVVVQQVSTRRAATEPWRDNALLSYWSELAPKTVIAVNAPLTVPACLRCQLPACPGKDMCEDPAVVWLRTQGRELAAQAMEDDRDQIAAVPGRSYRGTSHHRRASTVARIEPYIHRGCEVVMHYKRGVLHRDNMGRGAGPIAARASHLRRCLAGMGFQLNHNLLEVSARATVHSLVGPREARGYRRDADPWHIRATIIEGLEELRFSLSSRLAREDVLRNDHCFDALISAYTAYLWARDGGSLPEEGAFQTDGWIWVP